MAVSPDPQQGAVRLFAFDIPLLKQGQALAEQTDLSSIQRVLDIACGSGDWVLAAAQAYPHMQIVGVDTNAALLRQAQQSTQNQQRDKVRFQQVDALDNLMGVEPSFDLVNIRFIAGFTQLEVWSRIIAASLRQLRPGGILRITEGDTPITVSPAFERFSGFVSRALWLRQRNLFPGGQNVLITPLLRRLLQNANCEAIEVAPRSVEFSIDTEAHEVLTHHFIQIYRDIIPLLIASQVATQEEADQVHAQMVQEMQGKEFSGVGFYLTAWGRKGDTESP